MSDPNKTLSQKADQCVKCGLCLSYCPTFALSHDENRSPRGRISLIEGLAQKTISPTPSLKANLESCLSCYRCQLACPADVDYTFLIETARQQWAPTPLGLFRWGDYPAFWRTLHSVLWLADALKLRYLAKKSGLVSLFGLKRQEECLPPVSKPQKFKPVYLSDSPHKGELSLFLGCVSRFSMQETWIQLIPLLNKMGYTVHIPQDQGCCGALFAHSGHPDKANHCKENNKAAFSTIPHPILTFASGCHRDLKKSFPVVDVMDFLATLSWENVNWKPCHETIYLHKPCTQQNSPGLQALLQKIPGISIEHLPSTSCCGAAGLQGITQETQSDALGQALLAPLLSKTNAAQTRLLTTNIGCALHMSHLLSKTPILVQHPLTFLLAHIEA